MTVVRVNVVANLFGGVVNALLGIVLVPFYLRWLGVEAYGLVGFFATLQAFLGLLDLGLGITLNRGLARLAATPGTLAKQRDLLRTLETIYWSMSVTLGVVIVAMAEMIGTRWVNAQSLAPESIVVSVQLMGIVIALHFPLALYQAGLLGLQRQVTANAIATTANALRGAVTLVVLAFVSATIEAFFTVQALITFAQTAFVLATIWRLLGRGEDLAPPHFRASILRDEWKFAAAISANAIVGAFLTQSDKVVLSGLLPLAEFGYYVVAGTVAAALWFAISPVNTAVYPRFTQLLELRDEPALVELYHTAAQLVGVAVIPAALTLIFFGREVVYLWTGDAMLAAKTATPVSLLVAGTAINGLVSVPAYLQSAAGWPQLTLYTNMVGAVVLVPAIVFAAMRFGAAGAAAAWVVLNCSYLVVTVPIMHTRLIPREKWRWYVRDVAIPVAAAAVIGTIFYVRMPALGGKLATAAYVAAAGLSMLIAMACVCDRLTHRAAATLRGFTASLHARKVGQ